MAIFYLDYVNGNDANTGADWANAWKTITGGATAARIAPGDVIRIAKSPDPTLIGNATWTNLSRTVTLAAALTANVDMGEVAWTASTNVTCTTSTTSKEGATSASIAIAAAFTTGLVAYKALAAATNFSGYQQLSFWIRTSVAIAADTLKLCLCSDAAGATIVDEFVIPAVPATNKWTVFTVNKGAALGTSIQSIALYAIADPGAPTILLDNIIACKATSAADSLSLTSLISKNSLAQGGTEGWYGIKSINGTTIELDNDTEKGAGTGRGYSGTTETIATYKRETIKTTIASASTTVVQDITDSGTSGSNIEFQGGWNTSTTTQDGETYFDGQNGFGYGLQHSSKSYITLNYLNFSRYYYGVYYNNSNNNTINTLSNANNNSGSGVYFYNSSNNNTINTLSNANNNSSGVYYNNSNNNTINALSNANNNTSNGVYCIDSNNNTINTLSNANNNSSGVYYIGSASNNTIKSLSTSGNATAGILNAQGINYFRNALIAETTEVSGFVDFANSRIFSTKHDQITDNHKIFTDGGLISSELTVRHTASGIAWKLSPTSTNRSASYPLGLSIAKIAVNANALVTVKAWFLRDNTGITGRLICKGKQIAGVDSDVYVDMTAAASTWEELTITFTPTEAGVVEIEAHAYGGTAYNVYVDDMTISQA